MASNSHHGHGLENPQKQYYKWDTNKAQADYTLFVNHSNKGQLTALFVHIDDIIITMDDSIEQISMGIWQL